MDEENVIVIRLLKDDLDPIEIELSQLTPRSVSTLFSE